METFPETIRAFVAIPLPEPVTRELARAQTELREALPRGAVRWTRSGQFHLTLRFLGDVQSNQIDALKGSLRETCARFAALSLRAERIGFFPDQRHPRVIWASVNDRTEQLPRLQDAIEAAVGSFTNEQAEKKFTGHVTLGRCPGIKRPEAETLARLAHGMTDRLFGEWTAREVELVRSELSPVGARYTTLASIPLADEISFGKLPPT